MLPYEYCIGNEMGERFPTCIEGHFIEEFENVYTYALHTSFLGW